MKIEEYAPAPMPTSSANAKSLNVSPPKTYSVAIGSSVMNVVARDRGIVSHSDTFASVRNDARFINGMFSRTRSRMMIVS